MKEPVRGARRALGEMLAAARRSAGGGRGVGVDQVAERAGVGETWYRWLEEGRNIGLSAIALGWVADALGLRGAARHRLFGLAGTEEADELPAMIEPVRPSVHELIEESGPYPAYVYGRRGDILAWNDATEAVYRCHLVPPPRRNTYLFVFAQPEVRKLIINWSDQAIRHMLELKATMARAPHDPALAQLRRLLEAESPDFRTLWRAKLTVPPAVKVFRHPRAGRLVFDVESLMIDGEPGMRARFYLPRSGDGTRGRVAQLLALHRRDARNGRRRALRETVRKVKDHIDTCYAREIPLDELAALAGMDKYRLLRAFGSEVGFPPHAYQALVRVFHARQLLSAGHGAAQVALAVGFTDQSHLIRQFRRVEGMTPAAFVAQSRSHERSDVLASSR
jgi:AraC-like DNA-binding protein